MKPADCHNDNPTGALNPCLGRSETQLEIWPSVQLELAIEITWKELDMNDDINVLETPTHDLRIWLTGKDTNDIITRIVRNEIEIRHIVNTSVDDGISSVKRLETDDNFINEDKITILEEAANREMTRQRRLTLVGKIRATKKRIAKLEEVAA